MVNTTRSTLNMSKTTEEKTRSTAWTLLPIAFIVLCLAFILSGISFFAPFWYEDINNHYRVGLWGRCNDPDLVCIWFMERNYAWEKSITDWHIASQILFAIGIGLYFISLMTAIGQLIFRCCKTFHKLPMFLGMVICIGTLFELLSIIIFGVGAYRTYEVSLYSWIGRFEWAFYVGIASLFVDLTAGLLFIHAGRVYLKEMNGYEPPYGS